jgi:hypothetical protein
MTVIISVSIVSDSGASSVQVAFGSVVLVGVGSVVELVLRGVGVGFKVSEEVSVGIDGSVELVGNEPSVEFVPVGKKPCVELETVGTAPSVELVPVGTEPSKLVAVPVAPGTTTSGAVSVLLGGLETPKSTETV